MTKICILDCDDAKAWSPISFGDMFEEFVKRETDECLVVNIAREKQLPANVSEFPIVVITGSRHNCRDGHQLPWFEALCDLIRQAAATGTPRIYGGCFGCQITSHALGGQVDYNPGKNLVLKAETIAVRPDLFAKYFGAAYANGPPSPTDVSAQSLSATPSSDLKTTFHLIESHGDCVITLPPNAELLASSASCAHEIYVAGPHRNILACQSHPEFELQYSVYERIWPEAVEQRKRLNEDEVAEYKKTFEAYDGRDAQFMRALIRAFLHQ
jgi:GMP synthase-like glutamine amidotransferase